MRERTVICAGLAALVALALAACGGSSSSGGSGGSSGSSNGVAGKTANQIVAAASQAINGVSSVKVRGSIRQSSSAVKLDLSLAEGKGATGSVSENGLSLQLVSVGGTAYVKGSPAFLKQFGGASAVRLFSGHWMRAPASSGPFASLGSLTDLHTLVAGLLSRHGALTKGGTSTVDGTPVIAVDDKSKGGTLYVATTGTPYPIEITNTKSSSGSELSFSGFDQPVTLTAPKDSIDITKLK